MSTLNELRTQWEKGIKVMAEIKSPSMFKEIPAGMQVHGSLLVITRSAVRKYSLLRYFTIGTEWAVSADVSNGTAAEVLDKLSEVIHLVQ